MARSLDTPIYEDVKLWKLDQVSDWLSEIGFYEFVGGFESKNIDGKKMLTLSEDELRRCYPNMRGGRGDPSIELMKQINKVKSNKKRRFLPSINLGKRNTESPVPPPVPRTRDYPTDQRVPSQDVEEQWPEGEFDDAEDEYDDPSPDQPIHPRSSSYGGSTGTTASSTTTGDSDQFYMEAAEEDYDQTYDSVPNEDIRIQSQPVHTQMLNPHSQQQQMRGRSPSPHRQPAQPPINLPPRPAKTKNLAPSSAASRDLPPQPNQRSPRHFPPTGGGRMPPALPSKPTNGRSNGVDVSDSDDDPDEYLIPTGTEPGGDLYEVAETVQPDHLPQHHQSRLPEASNARRPPPGRISTHEPLPPPPVEEELYVDPNEPEDANQGPVQEEELYVVPNEEQDQEFQPQDELYVVPGENPDQEIQPQDELYTVPLENLDDGNTGPQDLYIEPIQKETQPPEEGDDFYWDPNAEPTRGKILQNRELPPPPSPNARRPQMPPPQSGTQGLPQRPPKPESINGHGNPPAPAIPTRLAKPPMQQSRVPMNKVLPNPSSIALNQWSPGSESKPVAQQDSRDNQNHIKPNDDENNEPLGSRKLSNGSNVSNLRDRFNNNNSVKPDVSPRPARPSIPGKSTPHPAENRPGIPGRATAHPPPERAVPSLPKRVQPSSNNIPTPSIPMRVPAAEPETASVTPNPSSKRWPPVQTNTNTVEPPIIIKPVVQPPIPKPVKISPPQTPVAPAREPRPSPRPSPRHLAPAEPIPVVKPPPSPTRQRPKSSNELDNYPWYYSDIKRGKAFQAVTDFGQDGGFLVRDSESKARETPYSLTLWYASKIRNLKIRRRDDGKFALGNWKENELTHDSPSQMIQYYQQEPVILANDAGKVKLKTAVFIDN